jgi:methylated-DNA-[protein]-cysteine S-methyltransferase
MNQINIERHQTEIGELVLGSFGGKLCLLGFGDREMRIAVDGMIRKKLDAEFVEQSDKVLEQTMKQVDEYLSGNRKEFDMPLLMVGTVFQRRVWKALMRVPYGATYTYGQIAEAIDSPRAVRAVGNANAVNPISIIVPCHRIIGGDGGLVGYGGGLSIKRRLLELERSNLTDRRQDVSGQADDHSGDIVKQQQSRPSP